MSLKQQLITHLASVLKDLGIEGITPQVDYPADPAHGEYATNVALVAAKKIGKKPMELAEEIAEKLRVENGELRIIEKIEVVKPGFINIWIQDAFLIGQLQEITTDDVLSGIRNLHAGQEVVVEYSSPNIAKPFTIGHLRSTIIGDAIANLLEATGWKVYRDNHIGDWGTQFGKQIAALKFVDYQAKDRIETGPYFENLKKNITLIEKSDRPVKLLVEFYVLFHELEKKYATLEHIAREEFKELEFSNLRVEAQEYTNRWIWKKCIEWSWREFESIYKELGVTFTENNGRGYGESFFEDKMKPVIAELEKKGLLETGEEGAKIVQFQNSLKLPPLMILKKDGATLYSTRDLATDKFRLDLYGKDVLIINEVGAEQVLYFRQLYAPEEMLGWVKPRQRVHIKHGLYRFKDQKMSTRKGNVVWLEDVLAEAEKRAGELAEGEKANKRKGEKERKASPLHPFAPSPNKQVGIGAIKWNDLKRSPEQDIVFDWDDILNMQGNSGPYLQYTYARTQSVLRKEIESERAKERKGERAIEFFGEEVKKRRSEEDAPKLPLRPFAPSPLRFKLMPEERDILRLLIRFPEMVGEAAERFAPNLVATYLFQLAQAFNLFYQKLPILRAEEQERELRISLTAATGSVIAEGLWLLGIQAPEAM